MALNKSIKIFSNKVELLLLLPVELMSKNTDSATLQCILHRDTEDRTSFPNKLAQPPGIILLDVASPACHHKQHCAGQHNPAHAKRPDGPQEIHVLGLTDVE